MMIRLSGGRCLAERLGVEVAEIVPTAGHSTGASGEDEISVFLLDLAAGGAGLSARMAEAKMLIAVLTRAQSQVCRTG